MWSLEDPEHHRRLDLDDDAELVLEDVNLVSNPFSTAIPEADRQADPLSRSFA